MRTSNIMTISLPAKLLLKSDAIAKKNSMTRSELVRLGLRRIMEELELDAVIREYEKDKRAGKLKELKGTLIEALS